jgi:hypothetical protein
MYSSDFYVPDVNLRKLKLSHVWSLLPASAAALLGCLVQFLNLHTTQAVPFHLVSIIFSQVFSLVPSLIDSFNWQEWQCWEQLPTQEQLELNLYTEDKIVD